MQLLTRIFKFTLCAVITSWWPLAASGSAPTSTPTPTPSSTPQPAVAQPPSDSAPTATRQPEIVDLGNQRYRIGTINIDKSNGSFTVPGVVLRHEPPLEYVAVTKGGMKGYESLLELDVDAFEFNLACVLIGLDPENASPSEGHFAEKPIDGDRVSITVSWTAADQVTTVAAGDLLVQEGVEARKDDWAYTGSLFSPEGFYLAQEFGPLIGFVHDPVAVIDHVAGLGLGNWGSVLVREDLPADGSTVTVTVTMLQP